MLKIRKYAVFFAITLCLILLLCWHLFVPSLQNSQPLKTLREGVESLKITQEITLRADLVEVLSSMNEEYPEKYLHYVFIDADGQVHCISDIGTIVFAEPYDWSAASFAVQIDGKVIIGISSADAQGNVSDNLGSAVLTLDETLYADTAVQKIDCAVKKNIFDFGCAELGQMQFVVLQEVSQDYLLTCGEKTLSGAQIEQLLRLGE